MRLDFNSAKIKEKTLLFLNRVPGYQALTRYTNAAIVFLKSKTKPFTAKFMNYYVKANYQFKKIKLFAIQKLTEIGRWMPENIDINFFVIYSIANWRAYLPSKVADLFDKQVDWLEKIVIHYFHPLLLDIRFLIYQFAKPIQLKVNIPLFASSSYIVTAFFLAIITPIPVELFAMAYILGAVLYALNARSFQNEISLKKGFFNSFSTFYSIVSSDFLHSYIPLIGLSVLFPAYIPCLLGLHYDVLLAITAYRSLMVFNATYSTSGARIKENETVMNSPSPANSTGVNSAYRSFRDSLAKQANEGKNQIEAAPLLSKLWLRKYYSAYEMSYLESTKVNHYSYLIGLKIEDYFFLNQSYKPVHILMTTPLLLTDTCRILIEKRKVIWNDVVDSAQSIKQTVIDSAAATKELFETFVPALSFKPAAQEAVRAESAFRANI